MHELTFKIKQEAVLEAESVMFVVLFVCLFWCSRSHGVFDYVVDNLFNYLTFPSMHHTVSFETKPLIFLCLTLE